MRSKLIGNILTGALACCGAFFATHAVAVGVWDDNATLVGLNPNGSLAADEVRIKKSTGGNSGCTVVRFRPGYGSIPAGPDGIDTRNRIYATALSAYMTDKPVSIWVYDIPNCYGLMLVLTDASGF